MMEAEKTQCLFHILKIRDTGDSSTSQFQFDKVNWQEIFAFAVHHNVEPLVYFHLKEKGIEKALPSDVCQQLRESYYQNSARNLRLYHELSQILERLNESHLPVIVLKGAFLAVYVYPNPALRTMTDLDILMRPGDIPTALEVLKVLGYTPIIPPWVNSMGFHAVLGAPECTASLEIHWDLTTPNDHYQIPVDELWARAVSVEIGSSQVLALCPEHLILHLCHHAAINHLFAQGLRPLVDIDRAVRRYRDDLDWEIITSLSSAWGLQKAVSLTMLVCQQYLDTPVPESVFENLECAKIDPEILQDTLMQISSGPEVIEPPPTGLFKVQAEKRMIRKVMLFLQYVFLLPQPPYQLPDERPKLLTGYYVFRRLMYLMGQHSGSLWKLVRNRQDGARYPNRKWMLLRWLQE